MYGICILGSSFGLHLLLGFFWPLLLHLPRPGRYVIEHPRWKYYTHTWLMWCLEAMYCILYLLNWQNQKWFGCTCLGCICHIGTHECPNTFENRSCGKKKNRECVSTLSGIGTTWQDTWRQITCCRTVRYHRLIPRNVFRLIVDTHQRMNWWERGFLLQEWVWWTDCNSIGFLGAWGWIVCWSIDGHHRRCCHTIGRNFLRCKRKEKRNSGNQTHRMLQLARQRVRLLVFGGTCSSCRNYNV